MSKKIEGNRTNLIKSDPSWTKPNKIEQSWTKLNKAEEMQSRNRLIIDFLVSHHCTNCLVCLLWWVYTMRPFWINALVYMMSTVWLAESLPGDVN